VRHDHRRDAGRHLKSRAGGQESDIAPDVGGLCDSDEVRARDDDGVELNAAFTVEADGPYLRLGAGKRGQQDRRQRTPAQRPVRSDADAIAAAAWRLARSADVRAGGDTVLVRTTRSPDGQPVEVGEVQEGLDKLKMHGSVRVNVEELRTSQRVRRSRAGNVARRAVHDEPGGGHACRGDKRARGQ
jgi:hypothetical protein